MLKTEALNLYKAGADHVILHQVRGGQKIFELINLINRDKKKLKGMKREHIKYLNSVHRILY